MDSTTHALPATPKQIAYARSLALRNQTLLPWEVQQDRRSLSAWIEAQAQLKPVSRTWSNSCLRRDDAGPPGSSPCR